MKLALQGRAHITLDPKGRLHLPTRFQTLLRRESQLVITNSIHTGHRFLDVYTRHTWQLLVDQISALPALRTEVQSFQRYYIASGEHVELDKQGRFLLPSHFREYAQLRDETVLIGAGEKMEIWNATAWNAFTTALETRFDDVVKTIAELSERQTAATRPRGKAPK